METTIEVTRMSSKGQLVLPKSIRKKLDIKKGTLFALKAKGKVIMLKEIANPILKEDIATLDVIERAWKEIDSGKFHHATKAKFLKALATW